MVWNGVWYGYLGRMLFAGLFSHFRNKRTVVVLYYIAVEALFFFVSKQMYKNACAGYLIDVT